MGDALLKRRIPLCISLSHDATSRLWLSHWGGRFTLADIWISAAGKCYPSRVLKHVYLCEIFEHHLGISMGKSWDKIKEKWRIVQQAMIDD